MGCTTGGGGGAPEGHVRNIEGEKVAAGLGSGLQER